jgi:hypothetical protein
MQKIWFNRSNERSSSFIPSNIAEEQQKGIIGITFFILPLAHFPGIRNSIFNCRPDWAPTIQEDDFELQLRSKG